VAREEILALSGVKPGDNLFAIDKETAAKTIGLHPLIKSAAIERRLFHTLNINIAERKTWAVIPFKDIFLCVDDEGVCIDKLNTFPVNKYPIITLEKAPAQINFGQAVEPQAINMIKQVWQSLPENNRQIISEFHYVGKEKSLIIYTIKGTEVRFGNLERLNDKIKNFAEVPKLENSLEKEGKDVLQYVDLRFEGQPVVKTRA
jgi:cell division protein FtsQ